jgi:hypothetical protein
VLKDVGDGRDGVIAGRCKIEGELDERDPFLVDGDGCDLAAAHVLADVEIAEAAHADGATVEELAFEADLDLLAIVA